jgi:hypothetical protein
MIDDTVRILKRKPLNEYVSDIEHTSLDELESVGYTFDSFMEEYDKTYTLDDTINFTINRLRAR